MPTATQQSVETEYACPLCGLTFKATGTAEMQDDGTSEEGRAQYVMRVTLDSASTAEIWAHAESVHQIERPHS
jgi:protein-disulfide isomerase